MKKEKHMKSENKSTNPPITCEQEDACDLTEQQMNERIDRAAADILERYRSAFEELAK